MTALPMGWAREQVKGAAIVGPDRMGAGTLWALLAVAHSGSGL
ncbi:hypothetical protein EDD34_0054 [Myceligenerans xiligouense]|uniref:Uncharacterized protein n=1 Tax=Myceligenerans xiligouense TaxID=253184 RepID=A0A3N4ZFE3_9MICO|nr:hypothetical protein EDD34_0054 [Myceligenerans xiligouense]